MATIKAVLNRDREKKGGGYSLVIQILHKRKKRLIYSPYILRIEQYVVDKQKAVYCPNCESTIKKVREINLYISKVKKEIQLVIDDLVLHGNNFTAEEVVQKYKIQQADNYVFTFMNRLIQTKLRISPERGTAKPFISTRNSLMCFTQNYRLKFTDITPGFVKQYETYLYAKPLKKNTVSFYLRNLRTIYNMADNQDLDVCERYPFYKMNMNTEQTIKRSLKSSTIKQIAHFDCPSHSMEFARDIFMFSFYSRGMSFIDIAFLAESNIEDNMIYYRRSKTKQLLKIMIGKELLHLITKYRSSNPYIFGLLNPELDKPIYKQYQTSYGVVHDNLGRLRKLLELSTPLTMHVARHSWASIAKEIGVPMGSISEGLGHTSEKTTQVYLRELEQSVLDLVNEQIMQLIKY